MKAAGIGIPSGATLISDLLLLAPAASFDFTSIPSNYTHLGLMFSVRSDQSSDQATSLQVNGDTGTNYAYLRHYRDSGSADAWASSTNDTKLYLFDAPSNSRTAGYCVAGQIIIPDYASATLTKHFLCPTISGFTNVLFQLWSNGNWLSAAAINRLTLKPAAGNWQTGSRASLFGFNSSPFAFRFTQLIDVPSSYSGQAGKAVTVKSDETGLGFTNPGGILAVAVYAPATDQVLQTTSSTLADIDATNIKVTFTAPPSGNVLVTATAAVDLNSNTQFGFLGLREASSNVGSAIFTIRDPAVNTITITVRFYLTGISAGSHTYKLSFASTGGATYRLIAGPGTVSGSNWAPPVTLVVEAAP